MQTSKTHHYVPVFYLKRWCNCDGKLHVVRNINGRIDRQYHPPKKVGFETHLYSYDEKFSAIDRAEIETKYFKPLDDRGAVVIRKFLAGKEISPKDRMLWAQFLTSMKVRIPESVDLIRHRSMEILNRELDRDPGEYERLKNASDPDTASEWLKINRPGLIESIGIGQLPKIASNEKAIQDVLSFSWHLVDLGSATKPLLCSDRPCVYTEGLDKPNCTIALPLSPRHAFFAFRPNSNAEHSLKEVPISRLARAINESVVGQAKKRVFARCPTDAPDNFILRTLSASH